MAMLTRRIDALGRITIPKEIRKSMNCMKAAYVQISATQNGILIKNADDNLQKDYSLSLINIFRNLDGVMQSEADGSTG